MTDLSAVKTLSSSLSRGRSYHYTMKSRLNNVRYHASRYFFLFNSCDQDFVYTEFANEIICYNPPTPNVMCLFYPNLLCMKLP